MDATLKNAAGHSSTELRKSKPSFQSLFLAALLLLLGALDVAISFAGIIGAAPEAFRQTDDLIGIPHETANAAGLVLGIGLMSCGAIWLARQRARLRKKNDAS